MQRIVVRPVFIDVVTKLFNHLWNLVCADWLMLASTDFDTSWSPIPGV